MYSQAPLKHRKLLITFVIIGPRVDRGASINQGVSPPQPVFFLPSKTIKMAGDQDEVEGKRCGSEGEARLVPEITARIIPVLIGISRFRKYYISIRSRGEVGDGE